MLTAAFFRVKGYPLFAALGFGDSGLLINFFLMAVSYLGGTIASIAGLFEGGEGNRVCGALGIILSAIYIYLLVSAIFA